MHKKEKQTELIKFRVTPSELKMIDRAVALQKRKILSNRSKCCRELLKRWASHVITEASATDAGPNSTELAEGRASS